MAITPRTIFTNPASAAVMAASLLGFTAAGMYLTNMCGSSCSVAEVEPAQQVVEFEIDAPCEDLRLDKIADKSQWSEYDWFEYGKCFEKHQDSHRVIEVSTQGLNYYPASEALYNLKGYHQISLHRYEDAVKTLETGLRRVGVPSDGVMTNNLAWAGLWVPRELDLHQARSLYKRSLASDSGVCETIHTGLWVEYAIARESRGIERAQALRNFTNLRLQYKPCQDRYDDGNRELLLEVLGAAVIFEQVDREMQSSGQLPTNCNSDSKRLMQNVSKELRKHYRGASIDALCREASPLATAHHTCVDLVDKSVTQQRHIERTNIRHHRRH
ncbi:MAG: hypothetical protein VYE40_06880 [Myxococcota bacterium]|jgi:hypothetical protein|nr:hypothetical protein [Myxococcota bacterium]MEC9440804.1 hypothetical protein [Myxococcota bacterium]